MVWVGVGLDWCIVGNFGVVKGIVLYIDFGEEVVLGVFYKVIWLNIFNVFFVNVVRCN